MTSPNQRSRQPLAELPLHLYVSQSLDSSPKSLATFSNEPKTPSRSRSPSLPLSQRNSRAVSPHKQAVMQSYRRVRESSITTNSVASLPSSASDSDLVRHMEHQPVSPRRLFPEQQSSSSNAFAQSSILPNDLSLQTQFSPKNIRAAAHHQGSRPATPSGSKTTPSNLRLHRPPHTSGPKPTDMMEPSPSTQRFSEHRMSTSNSHTLLKDPTTPSRSKQLRAPSPFETRQTDSSDMSGPASSAALSDSEQLLKSLPKKKYRVSRTEVAIAHEEAGAGPIGSPSPCKVAEYFLPGHDKPQPAATWSVFEDPPTSMLTEDCPALSEEDGPPTVITGSSVDLNSAPSTPNKENRLPDVELLTSKVVPIALPDRAQSASAVLTSAVHSRKRGTGGRLSLLAMASDEAAKTKDAIESAAESQSPLSASKKSKNQANVQTLSNSSSARKASQSRKVSNSRSPEVSRGRRKISARHADQADEPDKISSRTRSRT